MEPVRQALSLYVDICHSSETPHDAILFIPTRRELEGTVIQEVVGLNATRVLLKGREVTVADVGRVSLSTERTFKGAWHREVVIAIYPTKKMLSQLDEFTGAHALIVVPWLMEDVSEWRRTWNPIMLGQDQDTAEPLTMTRVVKEGLKALTSRVNLTTGLGHPLDEAAAVGLLRLLHDEREVLDPASIRAWALRHHWSPSGAGALQNIAEKIVSGRRLRRASSRWSPDIMTLLRERAAQQGEDSQGRE